MVHPANKRFIHFNVNLYKRKRKPTALLGAGSVTYFH
ncbi:hypothetical protein AWM80_11320 [Bacillus subtilis subsp. subtilis]|nr:hypothetical protein QX56_12440 [Bacillus subtilis]AJW87402.1 hypothetical protein BIS30_01010 [Bacillus spizizenii]AMB26424.1 hypothetical protein AWM80_11320 [Bacillus subtilis subsp. subtilis]